MSAEMFGEVTYEVWPKENTDKHPKAFQVFRDDRLAHCHSDDPNTLWSYVTAFKTKGSGWTDVEGMRRDTWGWLTGDDGKGGLVRVLWGEVIGVRFEREPLERMLRREFDAMGDAQVAEWQSKVSKE